MKQQRKERRIDWDVEGYFHDWAKKRRKEVLAMEKAMDENPAFEESVEIQEGDSEEEILRKMEKDTELMHLDWRKGLSEEDWAKYTGKIERDRTRIWKHFIERNADYDYHIYIRHHQIQIGMGHLLLGELRAFSACGAGYYSNANRHKVD